MPRNIGGTSLPQQISDIADDLKHRQMAASVTSRGASEVRLRRLEQGQHAHEMVRWSADGGATFQFPDLVDVLDSLSKEGLEVDPLTYSVSADGTQLTFDSGTPSAGVVVVAVYRPRVIQ